MLKNKWLRKPQQLHSNVLVTSHNNLADETSPECTQYGRHPPAKASGDWVSDYQLILECIDSLHARHIWISHNWICLQLNCRGTAHWPGCFLHCNICLFREYSITATWKSNSKISAGKSQSLSPSASSSCSAAKREREPRFFLPKALAAAVAQ